MGGKQSGLYLVLTTASEPEGPSSDASIAKVELGGNEVEYADGFYYAKIPASYTKEMITLKVTPTDAKAVVTVDLDDVPNTTPGAYATDLLVDDLGDTGATITVTAEDGTTKYEVNLFADKATETDTDNSLAKVMVDGVELTADDSGTNYPYAIPFDYSGELTVTAEATSQYATVAILDTDNNPTVAGGQSAVVPVKVQAESGDVATYTVTITREAASTACDLTAFTINGFRSVIEGTNVTVKVVEGYDFSHTPAMSVSEKAAAVWNAEAKTVTVTAQDGTTVQTYTVAAAAEYVQPYQVTEAAHVSFAAAAAPTGYEWVYGPNYNPTMADFASAAVGGYDLAKASEAANVDAGKDILKVYVANCDMLTFNLGATGTRKVNVTMGETALVTGFSIAEKNTMYAVTCEVNSREAVVLELESFTKDGEPTNGGTRIFSIDVTPMADDPTSISDAKAAGMAIYAADGQVLISTAEAATIDVYAIDGRLVRRVELAEGTNTISGLARGMYLINNQKVIVK
ncbi:MAG: cadherin-like beta sandwich domain-containing protein [Bacteroidaceae bacterium]